MPSPQETMFMRKRKTHPFTITISKDDSPSPLKFGQLFPQIDFARYVIKNQAIWCFKSQKDANTFLIWSKLK